MSLVVKTTKGKGLKIARGLRSDAGEALIAVTYNPYDLYPGSTFYLTNRQIDHLIAALKATAALNDVDDEFSGSDE